MVFLDPYHLFNLKNAKKLIFCILKKVYGDFVTDPDQRPNPPLDPLDRDTDSRILIRGPYRTKMLRIRNTAENSQDYAQSSQRNCTFMNSASVRKTVLHM
jgi:hypothetical protein